MKPVLALRPSILARFALRLGPAFRQVDQHRNLSLQVVHLQGLFGHGLVPFHICFLFLWLEFVCWLLAGPPGISP